MNWLGFGTKGQGQGPSVTKYAKTKHRAQQVEASGAQRSGNEF